MVYLVPDICKDIRIVLDENGISEQLITSGDIDTLTLDEIIKSKIVDAVRIVECSAPVNLLETGSNFGSSLTWNTDGISGWITLPDDYMRLIVFRMSDWERPVYKTISDTDKEYALQSSRFEGIRGNYQKPVCALVTRSVGKVLEFYSCKDKSATVTQAVYLQIPVIENDGINICRRCYDSFKYMAASMVASTLRNGDLASSLQATSNNLLI